MLRRTFAILSLCVLPAQAGYTLTTFDEPNASLTAHNGTEADGINNAGTIVGTYYDASGNAHGYLYSGISFTSLNDPNAGPAGTFAYGINASSLIVGYYADSGNVPHGFSYNGSFTTMDDPAGANGTIAEAVNAAGVMVGAYSDATPQ